MGDAVEGELREFDVRLQFGDSLLGDRDGLLTWSRLGLGQLSLGSRQRRRDLGARRIELLSIQSREHLVADNLRTLVDQNFAHASAQLEAKSEELTRTARKLQEANEKLTQLSIQKDAFLSQISHELRTPMTSIRAFSEILRDGGLGPPDQARYAGIIQEEAIRLTRLLDDLLDLSVLEARQVSLNVQPANLGAVIDRAVAAASSAGVAERLEIRRDRAREDLVLETDPDRLAQVFINLIANAAKYCDAPAPRLTIWVSRRDGQLMVDFVDNGSGIPEESQAVIFEKFSRLGDHQKAGGAGLGLAICREVMGRLGGAITYLPGQGGAAFRVSLPIRAPNEAQGA